MTEEERPDKTPDSSGEPERTDSNSSDQGEQEQTAVTAADESPETGQKSNGKPERKRRRGGRGALVVALLACLIAVLAIAAVVALGYVGKQRAQALGERVATAEQAVQTTTQDVILPKISSIKSRLGAVATKVDRHAGGLSQVREDLQQTQTQLTELASRVQGGLQHWKLMEIEDLMLAANRQLLLGHDVQGARQALMIASRQLAKLNDPRLFDIRKAVINEIAALEALPDPDIEGMVLQLTALAGQVGGLPLASDVPDEYNGGGSDGTGDAQAAPAWKHFLVSIREALQGMLTIRHGGTGPITPLMPPDQAFFLRQNLQLKLLTAKLSLLQRRPKSYRASLASAQQWLRQFFATDDPSVSAAIEQLGQMQKVRIGWEAPDISESLTALRDFLAQNRDFMRQPSGGDNAAANLQSGGAEE